jgi:hypothetical protein
MDVFVFGQKLSLCAAAVMTTFLVVVVVLVVLLLLLLARAAIGVAAVAAAAAAICAFATHCKQKSIAPKVSCQRSADTQQPFCNRHTAPAAATAAVGAAGATYV